MRKQPYSFVDINNESEGDIAYCRKCQEAGLQIKLVEMFYVDDEPVLPDADNWCRCTRCGEKYPIYERKEEGQYTFPFAHISNPFESGSQFESIGKRKAHDRLKDYKEKD